MPIIKSAYKSPTYIRGGNLQSIYPYLFRRVKKNNSTLKRINTNDNDFLDLDWLQQGASKLAIISHGLEGSSKSKYVQGMVNVLSKSGWDCLSWNMRGCSKEVNSNIYSYHSGFTEDLHRVFSHCLFKKTYQEIILIGFSVGGNITLKFLGEQGNLVENLITKAITFSVPCDLEDSAKELSKFKNKIYMNKFLKSLHKKLKAKKKFFPEIDLKGYHKLKTFYDYDSKYTAKFFNYNSAEKYWKENSSKQYIKNIKVPTLLINAKNDPFLGEQCYPIEEAKSNPNFFLEIPENGGHNGFYRSSKYPTWAEQRTLEFIKS